MEQRIRTLDDADQRAGNRSLLWDECGDDRRVLANGIYLYRIESDKLHHTRRLVLIR